MNGLVVGVIGIAATIIDESMPPHFSEGVRFTDGVEETRDESARLRDAGADLIVVLSHLGLPQDIELARRVAGLDIVLSGHTHNRLTEPEKVGGTLIIQSGCHGAFVGRLDVDFEGGEIVGYRHALIPIDDSLSEDHDMVTLVSEALSRGKDMSEEVGQTPIALHRNTCLQAPMDDVLLAAVARVGGTNIAFSNGWRYGAPVPPGSITVNDLWNMVPVDPPVSTVVMLGREILDMMEENLEHTFSSDPFGQMGGYLKRFRGLTLHVKLENPKSRRIAKAFVGSEKLEPQKSYPVSFITEQGVPSNFGTDRKSLDVTAIAAMKTWFADPDWDGAHSVLGRGRVIVV